MALAKILAILSAGLDFNWLCQFERGSPPVAAAIYEHLPGSFASVLGIIDASGLYVPQCSALIAWLSEGRLSCSTSLAYGQFAWGIVESLLWKAPAIDPA